MGSSTVKDDQNLLGGIIFISYILAALLLTGWIVSNLYKLFSRSSFHSDPEHIQRIYTFAALAVISFATLSYHMLSFLIVSYNDWSIARKHLVLQDLSIREFDRLHLWEWMKTSTLFRDFARNICTESNGSWWWTERALIVSMAWNIYIAVEGSRRHIPNLWLYFVLDQILPVSFTINLFFLAVLITASDSSTFSPKVFWSTPKPIHQVIPIAGYFLALSVGPYVKDSSRLIPLVLSTRLILFYPYLGFRPKTPVSIQPQTSGSDSSRKQDQYTNLWRAYKASVFTIILGYVLLQLLHILRGSVIVFPVSTKVVMAIHNDYAVSALGYDLLIGITSLVAWYVTRPTSKTRRQ